MSGILIGNGGVTGIVISFIWWTNFHAIFDVCTQFTVFIVMSLYFANADFNSELLALLENGQQKTYINRSGKVQIRLAAFSCWSTVLLFECTEYVFCCPLFARFRTYYCTLFMNIVAGKHLRYFFHSYSTFCNFQNYISYCCVVFWQNMAPSQHDRTHNFLFMYDIWKWELTVMHAYDELELTHMQNHWNSTASVRMHYRKSDNLYLWARAVAPSHRHRTFEREQLKIRCASPSNKCQKSEV